MTSRSRRAVQRPELLLVDDRPWSVDSIIEKFSANKWDVTLETSVRAGIFALKTRTFAAAVFDLRLPPPEPQDRIDLEKCGVPLTWVDSVDEFSVGSVLGRYVEESLSDRIPYLYVSAMVSDQVTDDAIVIDKMSSHRETTLGGDVYYVLRQLIERRSVGVGEP